jgi:hypothetical protein
MRMPNPITSLDAAMSSLFHVVSLGRGASEFFRWMESVI